MSAFRFLRVNDADAVTGEAWAESLAAARLALRCRASETVVSAASYALGRPRGLHLLPAAICANCSKAIDDPEAMYCAVCVTAKQRAAERRKARRKAARAARTAESRRDAKRRQREGAIRAGIANRRAKRQGAA